MPLSLIMDGCELTFVIKYLAIIRTIHVINRLEKMLTLGLGVRAGKG